MFADKLRKSLLQAAIQGRLTEQLPTDGDARDLLKKIRDEKAKLIAAKKIKAEKPLPPVTDDEIPFELPANWCWCRLGEICEHLQRGKSPQYSPIKKYPVVAQKCNQPWGFTMEQAKFIDPDTINSYGEERFLQADDLLWNSTGLGTVGRMAIYDSAKNSYELAVADSHVTVIRLFKNFVIPRFVFSYITSPVIQSKINSMVSGSTKQKELSLQTVRNVIIPLPPLAEQLRIVERLDALLSEVTELENDERELNLHVKNFPRKMKNSLLQAAIQGRLTEQLPTDGDARDLLKKIRDEKAELIAAKKIKAEKPLPPVTDDEIPFELPANWCWCRLGDIGVFISGYTPKSDELTTEGKIPYFKVADMNTKGNEIWMHKTNLYLKTDSARTYEKNTIVYPKNGGAVLTNKKRILRQDSVVDLNTGGYKVMEPINLMYLFNFFLTINFKLLYKGTALPTLDNKRLQKLLFPLPPLAEQLRIVERLNELLPLCEI